MRPLTSRMPLISREGRWEREGWREGGMEDLEVRREGGKEGTRGEGREREGGQGEGEGEGEVGREVMTSLSPSHSGFLVCFFRHYLPDKN